jgi:hypothetical protein
MQLTTESEIRITPIARPIYIWFDLKAVILRVDIILIMGKDKRKRSLDRIKSV